MFGEGRSESPRMPSPWLAVSPPTAPSSSSTPAAATAGSPRRPRLSAGEGREDQAASRRGIYARSTRRSSAEPVGARRCSEGSARGEAPGSSLPIPSRSYNLRHEAAQRLLRAQLDQAPPLSCSMADSLSTSSVSSRLDLAHQASPSPPPPCEVPYEHPDDDGDGFFSLDLDLELPAAIDDTALAIAAPDCVTMESTAHLAAALPGKTPARPPALTRAALSSSAMSSNGTTTTSSSISTYDSPSPSSSAFDARSTSDSPALTPEKVAGDISLEASVDALAIAAEPDLLPVGEEMFGFFEPESDSGEELSDDSAAAPPVNPDTTSSSSDGPTSGSLRHPSSLAPEVDDVGNLEYKLQILPSTRERFDKLVTQMKWRLLQGGGLCVYEIGVLDDGTLVGLDQAAMRTSLVHLADMGREMGASLTIRRVIVVQREGEDVAFAAEDKDLAEHGDATLQATRQRRARAQRTPTHPALRRYIQRLRNSGRIRPGAPRPPARTSGEVEEGNDEDVAFTAAQDDVFALVDVEHDDDGATQQEARTKRDRSGKRRRNAARAKEAAAVRNAHLASSLGNVSTGADPLRVPVSSSEGISSDANREGMETLPSLRMLGHDEATQLLSTREISRFGKSSSGSTSHSMHDEDADGRLGSEASYAFGIVDDAQEEEDQEGGARAESICLRTGARLIVEAVLSRRLARNEAFIDFAALP